MRRIWRIVLAAGMAAAAIAFPAGAGDHGQGPGGRFAVVLIDADSLACSPCLASLEALCRAVPPAVQAERMIGILTFREGKVPDPKRTRILRTKWTGYSRAGAIGFPAAVDAGHVFDRLNGEGTTVILFDPFGGSVKRWTPPFSPRAIAEIAGYLLDRLSPIMEPRP